MRIPAALGIAVVLFAADRGSYELRGRIEPAPRFARVTISGAYSPFFAETDVMGGKFKFEHLAPGAYNITVVAPRQGAVERTVEVGPASARKGRLEVVIAFTPAPIPGAAERRNTVRVQDLAVPDRAKREYEAALKKLERRDVAAAMAHLKRAVELAPQFAAAWNQLGTIAYQSGEYPAAEGYFRRALEAHPGAWSPMVNLGGVLINLGRCQEALPYNERAARERPDDALANSQLGMTYYCMEQDGAAIKYLEIAKRLDPGHFSNPQLVLAEIYARRGDRARAAAELEDFLRRRPDAPNAAAVREQLRKLAAAP